MITAVDTSVFLDVLLTCHQCQPTDLRRSQVCNVRTV